MANKVKEYLTDPEVADLLRMKAQTLAVWRMKGKGPRYVRMGAKLIRYRAADVQAWVDAHMVEGDKSNAA